MTSPCGSTGERRPHPHGSRFGRAAIVPGERRQTQPETHGAAHGPVVTRGLENSRVNSWVSPATMSKILSVVVPDSKTFPPHGGFGGSSSSTEGIETRAVCLPATAPSSSSNVVKTNFPSLSNFPVAGLPGFSVGLPGSLGIGEKMTNPPVIGLPLQNAVPCTYPSSYGLLLQLLSVQQPHAATMNVNRGRMQKSLHCSAVFGTAGSAGSIEPSRRRTRFPDQSRKPDSHMR